ncbi:hypothetical protein GL263_20150, partial [Streptomyces durbertensis]
MDRTPHDEHAPTAADSQLTTRLTIRRAGRLYATVYDASAVSTTIAELRTLLTDGIQRHEATARDASHAERQRLTATIATTRQLLTDGHQAGPMAELVHMQLLADALSTLTSVHTVSGTCATCDGRRTGTTVRVVRVVDQGTGAGWSYRACTGCVPLGQGE